MGSKIKMSDTKSFKRTEKATDATGKSSEEVGNAKTKEIGSSLLETGKSFAEGGMSQEEKADTAYQGAKTVVGAIFPIVGMAMNLGDKIGAPIQKNLQKANSKGQVNERKAKGGYIAGTLLNPAKTLSRTLFDKEKSVGEKLLAVATGGISQVFKGNEYVSKLEKNNQKALGIYKGKSTAVSNQPSMASQQSISNLKRFNLGRMSDKINQV